MAKNAKGLGVNNIKMKETTNTYDVVEKCGDCGNTMPSVPFRGNK